MTIAKASRPPLATASIGAGGSLYAGLLGPSCLLVPDPVRRLHVTGGGRTALGLVAIRRGRTPAASLVAAMLRLPRPGAHVPVSLEIEPNGGSEVWRRTFGGRRLYSLQASGPRGLLTERTGVVELRFVLSARPNGLSFAPAGAVLLLGRFRVRLPGPLAPGARAAVWVLPGDRLGLSVRVFVPWAGEVLAYTGWLVQTSPQRNRR